MKNLVKTQMMKLKVKIQLIVGSTKEEKFLQLMMLISFTKQLVDLRKGGCMVLVQKDMS